MVLRRPLVCPLEWQTLRHDCQGKWSNQNAIDLANEVKDYLVERRHTLPPGVDLDYWNDRSKIVKVGASKPSLPVPCKEGSWSSSCWLCFYGFHCALGLPGHPGSLHGELWLSCPSWV